MDTSDSVIEWPKKRIIDALNSHVHTTVLASLWDQMINNWSTIAMMSGQMERKLNGPVMDICLNNFC